MVQKNLNNATKGLNSAIEKLTTGYKLNHAKDNPANYAMAKNIESKLSSWNVASENINIGNNLLETASSTSELISQHIIRIRDLCEQACNGTYGENSKKAIREEIDARLDEISRIRENTEFNDIKLFGEKNSNGEIIEKTINLQVGIDGSESSRITVNTTLYLDDLDYFKTCDVSDPANLDKLDKLFEEVMLYQTKIGSAQNRLECALEYAEVVTNNLTSSLSTIKDADIAEVSSEFIKYQILQQACITLLSTANQMPALALQLL